MIADQGDRRARDAGWFAITAVLLAAVIVAVYAPVRGHAFIHFDDPNYITDNTMVQQGLTGESVRWAFVTGHASNWHPLTWLSHMLDVELFGDRAGGHLLHNVVLHLLASVLLYYLLWRMTGALWACAFVAAVFALHPLRVESVAWASERKDVLSTLFWMLTMWAYLAYVHRGGAARYALVCATLALGLMAKPMLVTLPAALLLLDIWPLRRWKGPRDQGTEGSRGRGTEGAGVFSRDAQRSASSSLLWLLVEKLPLFALSIVAGVITMRVQAAGGAMTDAATMGLADRVQHVTVIYIVYLWKMLCPTDLGLLYPMPHLIGAPGWAAWQVAGSAALLLAITVAALLAARHAAHRYLLVGWLWYLGVLFPVTGILQVGQQAWADRFTYLPGIGIAIMVAWSARDLTAALPRKVRVVALAALGAVVLIALIVLTARQVPRWRDAEAIYEHTIAVTDKNWITLNNLGIVYQQRGDLHDAKRVFTEAVRIIEAFPEGAARFPETYVSLGNVAVDEQRYADAVDWYRRAIAIDPRYAKAYSNIAQPLVRLGRLDDAAAAAGHAIELSPDYEEARFNLGLVRSLQGRSEAAIEQWLWVLQRHPARPHLVRVLLEEIETLARTDGAAAHRAVDEVLRIEPGLVEAQQLRRRLGGAMR